MPIASILDEVKPTLSPLLWDHPEAPEPTLKPRHASFIKRAVYGALERHGYHRPEEWLRLVLTGSLTTYQYADDSDCDVSLFVDSQVLPEWSRAEMIGIMIGEVDGTRIPGTPYPLQDFVVSKKLTPADLYRQGLRSGYDIDGGRWIVPPDKDRSHNVEQQENGFYVYALQMADKMERLLRYEPDKAEQFWHQIHQRRMRDQAAGKGDFSESNIVYKFLSKRGLFPQLAELTGEHIAKTAALQGMPTTVRVPSYGTMQVGTNPDIARVADEYNAANGLGQHPQDYVPVNPEMGARIAQEYEQMPHAPQDPRVAAAYNALAQESMAQYRHAVNNGYRFEFYPEGRDPYPNSPREAVMDLANNRHMYVYPTEAGFGSSGDPTGHPLMADSGERWGGRPVTYNDIFRAIHDFYGHAKEGLGFRHHGEDNAYRQHAAMFSPLARQALASETRGQNSYVNWGPNGAHNQNANQAETIYAPQKAGLMPEWVSDPNLHAYGLSRTGSGIYQDWASEPNEHWPTSHRASDWQSSEDRVSYLRPPRRDDGGAAATEPICGSEGTRRMVSDQPGTRSPMGGSRTSQLQQAQGATANTPRAGGEMAQGAIVRRPAIGDRIIQASQDGWSLAQDDAQGGRRSRGASQQGLRYANRVDPVTKIAMPYDIRRDNRWHSGGCGEYAIALQQRHPELRLGLHRDSEDPDYLNDIGEGYDVVAPVKHVFAHDDRYAYDVRGRHPLPYKGYDIARQWDDEYDIPNAPTLQGHLPWDLDTDPHWGINAAHQHIEQYGDPTTEGYNRTSNFGPYGQQNQGANQAETVYAPQKAGLLPEWVADPNLHQQAVFSRTASALADTAYAAALQDGGITIGVDGSRPSGGFAFSPYKSEEMVVPLRTLTPDVVDHFITDRYRELHQPGHYLGIWIEGDQAYLDVSVVNADRDSAMQQAQQANQVAMYDLSNFEEIPVGALA